MKIKIPDKVKIGIHEYDVRYNPRIWHEEGLKGSANHITQEIQIDSILAPSQKLVTLLHEVNHMINDQYRCGLGEDEIDKMAEGFAELLIDNFGLEFVWSDVKDVEK